MTGPNKVIICPKCEHELTSDDMNQSRFDLWAIAPDEEEVDVECPQCKQEFVCQGGYIPQYTTWIAEEE